MHRVGPYAVGPLRADRIQNMLVMSKLLDEEGIVVAWRSGYTQPSISSEGSLERIGTASNLAISNGGRLERT